MGHLRVWFSLVLVVGAAIAVGCDDDRGVVDIGAGGDGAAQAGATSNAAGETTGGKASAGEGTGGSAGAQVDVGVCGASWAGGGAGGEGGGTLTLECPSDLFAADGTSCAGFAEGAICSDGASDPCQFGQSIRCVSGKWQRQEAFPAPCGDGGAGGNGGSGG
jgi:hypothetical protein